MKQNFLPADILLPKNNFEKWSVVACDQYTSEKKYWEDTAKIVGDYPSALNIILPEVYLSDDNSKKISEINKNMKQYLKNQVFDLYENTMVYTERTLKDGKIRKGLVGLIDLEDYSYQKGADTLIRATEATVVERIPARVNIRCDASIEIPHIMLLIDDADFSVIEPISKKKNNFKELYSFDLMQNSGHIDGFSIDNENIINIQKALDHLLVKNGNGLLFAVGDGNHSLASAKECYNMGKGSRYALVEVVNIHEASLEFEPIYRVLFGADPEKVIKDFVDALGGQYYGEDAQKFTCVFGSNELEISVKPTGKLSVATLQTFLDKYLTENKQIKIDYIHGINSVKELSKSENVLGFIFEGMQKSELFPAITADGSLPRKTFSMGCADDKRFYLEARQIKD